MRISVDLSTVKIAALDALAKKEKRSRAALIREAVDDYLGGRSSEQTTDAFGLWGKRRVDGLAYQRKVRSYW